MVGKKVRKRSRVDDIALDQARLKKRVEIMGKEGVLKQDIRRTVEGAKALITGGTTAGRRAAGREANKRVGEYREAKADKVIDKVKRYKNPGNK